MRLRTDYADPNQQADFYLLHHTSRSAVLIENLIMDTHEDCALKMDYHLDRFEKAQEGVWQAVLNEIEEGRKRSHWIWFVFPQLKGLGISLNADFYGISGSGEAAAYLAHPLLGARLREVCGKLLAIEDKKIEEIIPGIDAVKLRSSMTLFDSVSPDDIFVKVLEKYYQGARDTLTLEMLASKR